MFTCYTVHVHVTRKIMQNESDKVKNINYFCYLVLIVESIHNPGHCIVYPHLLSDANVSGVHTIGLHYTMYIILYKYIYTSTCMHYNGTHLRIHRASTCPPNYTCMPQ